MPNRLITLERAKREVLRLQDYIDMVEQYEATTTDQWIIKNYAITNSMRKVLELAAEENICVGNKPIDYEYIVELINGQPKDELHRILRLGYRQKIRQSKRK